MLTLIEKARVVASDPRICFDEIDGVLTLALEPYAIIFVNETLGTAFNLRNFSSSLPERVQRILKDFEALSQEGNPMELLHNAVALVETEPALTLKALSNANVSSYVTISHKLFTGDDYFYLSFLIDQDEEGNLRGRVVSKLDVYEGALDWLVKRGLTKLKYFEQSWVRRWTNQPVQSRP